MTQNSSPTLAEGTSLAHFSVRSILGTGGMGTVYLAEDTALERPVAVKVLHEEIAGDADFVDRFFREARAAARVNHPNLTHVYFVGTCEGRPFFAMEYCPGTTLEDIALRGTPVPLDRGLRLLAQAARGLAAAHGSGVVHRDVKPSNLLVLPDGTVKVADFGLSKSVSADVKATAGRIMGTPTYMSPEQVRGRPVDARTDVYLLGLTAFCLFAGKPAFASDQVGELINDQLNSPLPDLSKVRPDLPPALAELLSRMCEKDPEKRPSTMEEVAVRLESLRPRPLNPASLPARALATILDLGQFLVAGGAVLGATFLVAMLRQGGGDDLRSVGDNPLVGYMVSVSAAAILAFLQLGLELWTGRSFGKWALDLQVVRNDGNRPGPVPLVLRFLIRFPMFWAFLVPDALRPLDRIFLGLQGLAIAAGVVCFLVASGRTLSDLLTRTRVVYRFDRLIPSPRTDPADAPTP